MHNLQISDGDVRYRARCNHAVTVSITNNFIYLHDVPTTADWSAFGKRYRSDADSVSMHIRDTR